MVAEKSTGNAGLALHDDGECLMLYRNYLLVLNLVSERMRRKLTLLGGRQELNVEIMKQDNYDYRCGTEDERTAGNESMTASHRTSHQVYSGAQTPGPPVSWHTIITTVCTAAQSLVLLKKLSPDIGPKTGQLGGRSGCSR